MHNAKILIVEDDAGILELLRVRLEVAGYSTFYARTGQSAIDNIANINPDALILDIGLPVRDGFDVLRSIRAMPRFKTTPVLMLTARHEASDVQRAIACGAQDYLAKPFDEQKLLARVARLIRNSKRAGEKSSESPNWLVS